jgi:hypothetical protein
MKVQKTEERLMKMKAEAWKCVIVSTYVMNTLQHDSVACDLWFI